LRGAQKIEKEKERSDIEKGEGSGCSKSQTPVEKEEIIIKRIERTAKDFRMVHKQGQNRISMR
jgi:hypothetical protein